MFRQPKSVFSAGWIASTCLALVGVSQAHADNCTDGIVLKITAEPDGTIAIFDDEGRIKEAKAKPPTPTEISNARARVVACRKSQGGRELYKVRIGSTDLWLAERNVDLVPPPIKKCERSSQEPGRQISSRNVDCKG